MRRNGEEKNAERHQHREEDFQQRQFGKRLRRRIDIDLLVIGVLMQMVRVEAADKLWDRTIVRMPGGFHVITRMHGAAIDRPVTV